MSSRKTRKYIAKGHRGTKTIVKTRVYKDTEYNSNDGMLTTVWGPGIWHYLHTMSFNYPVSPSQKDKYNYRHFVLSLRHVLPCGKCRKNLAKNFRKHPLLISHMESRATFSKYIYDLHEVVNAMLKKKSGLSYDDVRERYEHFRARCAISPNMKGSEKEEAKQIFTKEDGCTEPLYGEKAKCLLRIVPQETKCDTLQIDKRCVKTRL